MPSREKRFKDVSYLFAYNEDHHASWFTHDDEEDVRNRFWNISKGDVVIDGGAAFGSYSLAALALGAEYVYAFIPESPSEDRLFLESLALNNWQDRGEVVRTGLWSRTGWLSSTSLAFHHEVPEGNGVDEAGNRLFFPVMSLDHWVEEAKLERLDWLKLDVEGAEREVLEGALVTIEKFRPKIMIENHTFKIPTIHEQCRQLVTMMGYQEIATVPYHAVSHTLYEPI